MSIEERIHNRLLEVCVNCIGLRLKAELNGTTKTDEPSEMPVTTPPTQLQSHASIQSENPQNSSTDLLVEDVVNIGHPWSTGLFDCWENPRNAVVTAFLPCVTFGQISEVLDEGNSSCCGRGLIYFLLTMASYSQWIMSTEYRTKLRKKFKLEEEPSTDVATHIFCPCCSLCQEFRELQNRQLDPSLGWSRILAQQQGEQGDGQLINAPPPNQVMSK